MWKQYIKVKKYTSRSNQLQVKTASETLLVEIPCTINCNNKTVKTVMCCPDSLEELAIGCLMSHKKISSYEEVKSIEKKHGAINITTTKTDSKKTRSQTKKAPLPSPTKIIALMSKFQDKSEFLKETGIAESAAIATDTDILSFSADLSTEIALYKAYGSLLKNKKHAKERHLILYGTIRSDIIKQCESLELSSIISRSGITQKAYEMAKDQQLGIITFCRGIHLTVVHNTDDN